MKTSLRALLLDFDGVLADTEPIHLRLFQQVLKNEGITVAEPEYYEKYLGLDDRSFFEKIFKDRGKEIGAGKKEALIREKNQALLRQVSGGSLLLPGVVEFLQEARPKYHLAVVSGALRNEIQAVLKSAKIDGLFHLIVAADDVSEGKPNPEGFLTAIRLLNRDAVPASEMLLAQECLAIEDSPWGIEAAKKAGVKCLALLTSYPREKLAGADLIAANLQAVKWKEIEELFRR